MATQITVISDTHIRHAEALPPAILEAVRGADLVVHCGDFTGEALPEELRSLARRLLSVQGNSDLPPLRDRLPRREVLRLHGWTIGVCHPYWGGFPDGIADEILWRDFADLRLDALLFGHTHERLAERRPAASFLSLGSGSPEGPCPSGGGNWGVSPQLLLVNPGPGYADFMSPASFARLRVSPAGIEAELVVLEKGG